MLNTPTATAGKIEKALGDLKKLPLFSATAQRAMALTNGDGSTLTELTRLVEKDVTLATSFLKLANSPLFTWGRTIESVNQAVLRLGFRECQNLILAISMSNLYRQASPQSTAACAILWQHCFTTACICRRINQELRYDYQGEEFVAGLLHDLGRVLLAITIGNEFREADPMDFIEEGVLEREQAVLQTNHCHFGAVYAEQNRLPFSAIAAIRFHHQPEEAKSHKGILYLVATADHLANYLQRGESPEKYDLADNAGFQHLARGWTPQQVDRFNLVLPKIIQESKSADSNPPPATTSASKKAAEPAPLKPAQAEGSSSILRNMRSWFSG